MPAWTFNASLQKSVLWSASVNASPMVPRFSRIWTSCLLSARFMLETVCKSLVQELVSRWWRFEIKDLNTALKSLKTMQKSIYLVWYDIANCPGCLRPQKVDMLMHNWNSTFQASLSCISSLYFVLPTNWYTCNIFIIYQKIMWLQNATIGVRYKRGTIHTWYDKGRVQTWHDTHMVRYVLKNF